MINEWTVSNSLNYLSYVYFKYNFSSVEYTYYVLVYYSSIEIKCMNRLNEVIEKTDTA